MIYTAADLFDALADAINKTPDKQSGDDIRRSILEGYALIPSERQWHCFARAARIATSSPYSTGTVQYTASTRLLTLSGGTWPAWAANATVQIANLKYLTKARQSGTVLLLDAIENPGADLTAGTAYQIVRDRYSLPDDFDKAGDLVAQDGLPLVFVRLEEIMRQSAYGGTIGRPMQYAFAGDPTRTGGALQVILFPPPSTENNVLTLMYQRLPRPITWFGYDTGKITTVASNVVVTGSGVAWQSSMVGSVLRISGDPKKAPTGAAGDNPAAFEATVVSVNSGTSISLDAAPTASYNQGAYRITDPVDVANGPMQKALLGACTMYLMSRRREGKSAAAAAAEYRTLLDRAKANDNPSMALAYGTGYKARW